jgi:hypothetical protein
MKTQPNFIFNYIKIIQIVNLFAVKIYWPSHKFACPNSYQNGTSPESQNMLENAQAPTSQVHAVLARF